MLIKFFTEIEFMLIFKYIIKYIIDDMKTAMEMTLLGDMGTVQT